MALIVKHTEVSLALGADNIVELSESDSRLHY